MINFDLEKKFQVPTIGIDEAGRGPLAGPVVSCALYLKEYQGKDYYFTINDSKKISEKKRDIIYQQICNDENIVFATAIIDNNEIDKINILQSSLKSMQLAYEKLNIKAKQILIDGNKKMNKYQDLSQAIIGGDRKVFSIAAASIIAKYERDRIMYEYAKKYPEYKFEKHKGYGTKLHLELIAKHGPSPIHRMSFKPLSSY